MNFEKDTVASTASVATLAAFSIFRSLARKSKIACWDIPDPYEEMEVYAMANRKHLIVLRYPVTTELSFLVKHTATYRQLKPVYNRYRQSRDKEKVLRGYESKIILFEPAARELKRMGVVLLPSTESMKTELAALVAKKVILLAEYRTTHNHVQEYETIKKNVDALLAVPKEQEQ